MPQWPRIFPFDNVPLGVCSFNLIGPRQTCACVCVFACWARLPLWHVLSVVPTNQPAENQATNDNNEAKWLEPQWQPMEKCSMGQGTRPSEGKKERTARRRPRPRRNQESIYPEYWTYKQNMKMCVYIQVFANTIVTVSGCVCSSADSNSEHTRCNYWLPVRWLPSQLQQFPKQDTDSRIAVGRSVCAFLKLAANPVLSSFLRSCWAKYWFACCVLKLWIGWKHCRVGSSWADSGSGGCALTDRCLLLLDGFTMVEVVKASARLSTNIDHNKVVSNLISHGPKWWSQLDALFVCPCRRRWVPWPFSGVLYKWQAKSADSHD